MAKEGGQHTSPVVLSLSTKCLHFTPGHGTPQAGVSSPTSSMYSPAHPCRHKEKRHGGLTRKPSSRLEKTTALTSDHMSTDFKKAFAKASGERIPALTKKQTRNSGLRLTHQNPCHHGTIRIGCVPLHWPTLTQKCPLNYAVSLPHPHLCSLQIQLSTHERGNVV